MTMTINYIVDNNWNLFSITRVIPGGLDRGGTIVYRHCPEAVIKHM